MRERGLKQKVPGAWGNRPTVAPRAGAWIETRQCPAYLRRLRVAPRAGAWIETNDFVTFSIIFLVAPRAGAWIETPVSAVVHEPVPSRSPCGSVD